MLSFLGLSAVRSFAASAQVLEAWGGDNGFTLSGPTPVFSPSLPAGVTVTQIASDVATYFALASDGTLYAWGDNGCGQLGNGTTTYRAVPAPVQFPAGVAITQISTGVGNEMALSADGTAYLWGCGGTNLGLSSVPSGMVLTPTALAGIPAGVHLTHVAMAPLAAMAVGSDGAVYAWGSNCQGQLGQGNVDCDGPYPHATPRPVHLPAGVVATSVATDGASGNALTDTGAVYTWGYNAHGERGVGPNPAVAPTLVTFPGGASITAIAAGNQFVVALDATGNVWAWGDDAYASVGDGVGPDGGADVDSPSQVQLPVGVTASAISTNPSAYHAVALAPSGDVYGWGLGTAGQLGNGNSTSGTPLRADLGAGVTISEVSASATLTFALRQGTVPDAPTIGTATGGNGSASVSWTAPADNGHPVTSYTVTASPGGASATVDASHTSATVTGLTNGTSYTFTVTATNSVGTSAPSAASNAVMLATVPGAPAIGTATRGNGSASVSWTAPSANGSPISGYTVTASPGGASATVDASHTSATVSGLTNGTSYTFTVTATNGVGTSAPSAASNSVVPAALLLWSTATEAVPFGTHSISCPTGNFCMLVSRNGQYQTLVDRNWSDAEAVAGASSLTGVSCTSSTSCVAVDDGGRAFTYTSGVWSAPSAIDAAAGLAGVSCTSTTSCMAVDTAGNVLLLSGTSWSSTNVDPGHSLTVVSCGSATFCVAADNNGTEFTYNTGTWSLRQIASTRSLTAIDCVGTFCIAGDNDGRGYARFGATWFAFFIAASGSTVEGISCVSTTFCVSADSNGGVEQYNGGATISQPAYIDGSGLSGVGCLSTALCVALNGPDVLYGHDSAAVPSTPQHVSTRVAADGYVAVSFVGSADDGASGTLTFTANCASGDGGAPGSASATATPIFVGGLTDGSHYACTVTGTNDTGAGTPSNPSATVLVGIPQPPGTVSATRGDREATVDLYPASDDGGSAVISFTATCTSSDGGATGTATSPAHPVIVGGLTNGKTYTCDAFATNAVGDSAPSSPSPIVVPAAVPDPPSVTGVTGAGSGAAFVSFTPGNDGSDPITSYTATCTTLDLSQSASASANATTIRVGSLINGDTYTCVVYATNTVGSGAASAPSSDLVVGGPNAFSAGYVLSHGHVFIGFSPPSDTGAAPISSYDVSCTSSDGGAAGSASTTASPVEVHGLTNGDTYTCTVTAQNGAGPGAPATTDSFVPGVPGATGTVLHTSPGLGEINVTFGAASDPGASSITGYLATCSAEDFGGPTITKTGPSSPILFTNVDGNAYSCWVQAMNTYGLGPATVDTQNEAIDVFSNPSAIRNLSAITHDRELSLTMNRPADDGNNNGFDYEFTCTSSNGGVTGSGNVYNPGDSVQDDVHGLTNGKSYTCSGTAIWNGNQSPIATSGVFVPNGPPLAPASVTRAAGNGSATVTWAAANNDGAALTGYVITPYLGAVAQTATLFPATATTQVITGLTNGKSYTFKVWANNADGRSPQTASGAVVIGSPAPPTGVNASSNATGTAVVTFTLGANNGNAITSQTATCTSSNGGVTKTGMHSGATAAPITVTALTVGKTYTCTVTATNGNGVGLPSAATAQFLVVGPPAAPTAVIARSGSTTTTTGPLVVTFTIGANNGSAISSQTATCISSNGGVTKTGTHSGATAAPITVAGLTTAKTYTCTVSATNARGTGPPSAPSLPVVVGSPAPPTSVTATKVASGQLKVTFTPGANNGSTITSYTATCTSSNGGATGTTTGAASPLTVTGLTATKTYTCTVKATNARGAGLASTASPAVSA